MAEHIRYARNRREFLTDCFCGAGSLAFATMLAESQARAARYNPLAPKKPHMPDKAKAKAFIFVYMAGGPSHLETWDPKPLLNQLHGQKRPAEFGEVKYQNVNSESRILGCKRTFQKFGKSGTEVSDLFPHQSQIVDDLCVVRSMHGDMVVHSAAQYQMMTGRVVPGFPSMGSWVVYGLGSEAESLPAYVVMPDSHGAQEAGLPMYKNGFLPAVYQPTMMRAGAKPVLNLDLPQGLSLDQCLELIEAKALNPDELILAETVPHVDPDAPPGKVPDSKSRRRRAGPEPTGERFSDGPPCLQHLAETGGFGSGVRNEGMLTSASIARRRGRTTGATS